MNRQHQTGDFATEAEIASDLVERIVAGDFAAESEMVARYQRGLEVVLFQRTKDRFVLEDVIQDTWVVVLGKVRNGDLRNPSRLAAFIIQIGKNQLVMKFRKNSRQEAELIDEFHEARGRELSPEQQTENAQLSATIATVFDELKQSRDKEILKRYFLGSDSKEDLCDEYGLTKSHFDRVLFRARQRFKALWSARELKQEKSSMVGDSSS